MVRNEQEEREYSKWALLDKMYKAKKAYYTSGKPVMTDKEYDALEASFVAIHGEEAKREWSCVGYDEHKHALIKLSKVKSTLIFKERLAQ